MSEKKKQLTDLRKTLPFLLTLFLELFTVVLHDCVTASLGGRYPTSIKSPMNNVNGGI